eukprot:TRINITY_DN2506_c0_g1_i8.p1 TRINITY_DN2506_c0_g1~~TRINITY_DN2506_c0_g1_i8.p1  ORF type:complete len:101 (+),score=30.98 TRINITY_DN2506_c0_g1_i8:113-415(+)
MCIRDRVSTQSTWDINKKNNFFKNNNIFFLLLFSKQIKSFSIFIFINKYIFFFSLTVNTNECLLSFLDQSSNANEINQQKCLIGDGKQLILQPQSSKKTF